MSPQNRLAIVAPSFNAPSETFIRTHVSSIAPGQTILICNDGVETESFACPVLTDIDPWRAPRTLVDRVVNAVRYRWRVYATPTLNGESGRRVVAFLKAHNATVMLAEYGPMGCLLMGACRDVGIPLYVHFHGYDASILVRDWRQRRHYRTLFRLAAGVIVPSRFLADKLVAIGCPSEKLYLCPCGIDPTYFRESLRLPGRVVAVGRLVQKKAPHLTIRAFGRIAARFPEARLDMIGEGPLRNRCLALVEELGLGSRIVLHGAQDNGRVAALLQEASLFVQHSVTAENGDTESFGVTLVEAMASSVPVVATRHNGFVDTVEHGVTGLLVDEHDVEGMADAMAMLLSNPARAAAMGAAGRARVFEYFTIEHTRNRLRAIMGLPVSRLEANAPQSRGLDASEPRSGIPEARSLLGT